MIFCVESRCKLLYYVQGYRNGDCRVVVAGRFALVGETGAIDLAYCEASELLLAGKHGRAFAFQAAEGEQVWEAPIGASPWILRGDTFLTQQGASFEVRTGEKVGEPVALRGGGCNYAVAAWHHDTPIPQALDPRQIEAR